MLSGMGGKNMRGPGDEEQPPRHMVSGESQGAQLVFCERPWGVNQRKGGSLAGWNLSVAASLVK